jgi:hypothetical protein
MAAVLDTWQVRGTPSIAAQHNSTCAAPAQWRRCSGLNRHLDDDE